MKIKNKAFTLVELIIVITILAILTTIGFVSFQSYTKNTRDSNRLATLRNIQNGLDVYFTKNNTLPQPENFITVSYSGENLSYQGSFGDNNANLVGFSKTPLDPLDSLKYTYSTSIDLKKYQVLTLLEDSSNLAFGKLETFANTNYSNRIPKTLGNGIGILLGTGTESNKPINFNYNVSSFTGVNIATNTGFVALISDSKKFTGNDLVTVKNIGKNGFDSSLIGYWDMETMYSSGGTNYIKDLSGNNGVDCIFDTGVTIVDGIKGKALKNDSSKVNSIRCLSNKISTGSNFSVFLSYKVNQIDPNLNLWLKNSPNYINFDSSTSVGIFRLNSSGSIGYGYANGKKNFGFSKSPTCESNDIDNGIPLNEWSIISLTFDGNNYRSYLNGIYKYSFSSKNNIVVLGNQPGLIIGATNFCNDLKNGAGVIQGDISVDEARLYDRALSDDEIKNISNQMR